MFALSVSILMTAQTVPEWKVLLDKARGDTELAAVVGEKAAGPAACMAEAIGKIPVSADETAFEQALDIAAGRCGFETEVLDIAASIMASFPGTSEEMAYRAADAWLGEMAVSAPRAATSE